MFRRRGKRSHVRRCFPRRLRVQTKRAGPPLPRAGTGPHNEHTRKGAFAVRPRCTKARRRQQAKPSEPPAPGIVGEADVAPATGPAADQDRWVGTRFLAELLGVSPPTVLSWERQRLLPP